VTAGGQTVLAARGGGRTVGYLIEVDTGGRHARTLQSCDAPDEAQKGPGSCRSRCWTRREIGGPAGWDSVEPDTDVRERLVVGL
jgi:hypothetical protein